MNFIKCESKKEFIIQIFPKFNNSDFVGEGLVIYDPQSSEVLMDVNVLAIDECTNSPLLNYVIHDAGNRSIVEEFIKLQHRYHEYMSKNSTPISKNIPYISLQLFEFKEREGIPSGSSKITSEQFKLYEEFGQFWEFSAIVLRPSTSILGKAMRLGLKLMANNMKSNDPTARVRLFTDRESALKWIEKEVEVLLDTHGF